MTRISFAKLLGGLALLAPMSAPALAGDDARAVGTQIYKAEDVIRQAAQEKANPEQSVPKSTESKNGAANGADAAPAANGGMLGGLMGDRVKVSGHIEQGYTWNPDRPHDRLNFGRLFDDRSNDYRLNQALITFERALDPKPCCTDWGFKAQFMYGSDARFIHSLGIMDNITDETVQPDIVELFATYHMPVLTEGGVDLKVGQFVTLMGAEVIYALADPLYSHSYIFNYGIPFKHTGVMATTHVNKQLDVHLGLVAGINTGSFDDNNDAWAFHGGFNWKSCDEKLNVAGSFHAGPENDGFFNSVGIDSNDDFRYIEDLVVTYKITDRLTTITDINIGNDEGANAEWYGWAQYFTYEINKCVSGVVRIEVFRDDDGFAVFKDPSNDGFIDAERGIAGPSGFGALVGGGGTTYSALTVGLNWKPYEKLLVRPEVRWDWAQNNTKNPFDDASDIDQFTLGFDVIWSF